MHNLGYGVVAFDAPAHGESSGWQNNLILTAQIMDQLLDLYPRIRGIIGHSFGGVSSSFLMSHMRKEFNLDFFILISTPTRVQRIFAEFFKIVRAPQKLQNRIIQDLKKRYAFDFEDFDVDINLTKAKIGQILVIHDENDRIVLPANAEAILKANPKAIWIKPIGLGHYLPVKHKKVITACEQILRQSIVRT
jgi:pimeloyl-ACP methyl ester carboxylesterase